MRQRIGWYVHHHGRGHLTRLLAIAPHLDADIECFSSLEAPADLPAHCRWTYLPRDDDHDGGDPSLGDPTVGGMLHWAPLGHRGHRDRLALIAGSLAATPADAFVVDVSAEVTVLVRLLGVPTVAVTQPGRRDDRAHRIAFDAATTIVAPWAEDLLEPEHLRAHRRKVVYTGGISRFDGRTPSSQHDGSVLLLGGAGGTTVTDREIDLAARATGRRWRVLGGNSWTPDPWDAMARAETVVAWAGQNSVADLAAAQARAIVIPQTRPFGEQEETAGIIRREGLATVSDAWPTAEEWPEVLASARSLRPDWSRWGVRGAAARAADAISETAVRR